MQPTDIKSALQKKGISLRLLAEVINQTTAQVSNIIHRKDTSRVTANAIAKCLGKPIDKVFPDVVSYHLPIIPKGKARESKKQEIIQLLAS